MRSFPGWRNTMLGTQPFLLGSVSLQPSQSFSCQEGLIGLGSLGGEMVSAVQCLLLALCPLRARTFAFSLLHARQPGA